MRHALAALLLSACTHTVAVRSASSDASCIDTCKRFDTIDPVGCAKACPGAVVSATECTPIEHGCTSAEELSTAGRVAIGIGTGVASVAGIVLSGLLLYVIVGAA